MRARTVAVVHADDVEWYGRCARRALELVDEFGHATLLNVEHVDELRSAVRRDARQRTVKIRTYALATSIVVQAVEPSVIAQAYTATGAVGRYIAASLPVPGLEALSVAPAVERVDPPWHLDCRLPLI